MSRYARLSPEDLTNFAFERPETPMHIGALAVLEAAPLLDAGGRLDLDSIRSRIRPRLQRTPALLRVLYHPGFLGGRSLWIDAPEFNIADHIRQAEVGPPGGEEEVLAAVTRLLEPLLDRSRPLWEMWFLTGLTGGRLGILIKLHHSIADGLAAILLLGRLFDLDPDAPDPAAGIWLPGPAPSWRELAGDNVADKLAALRRVAGRLIHPVALGFAAVAGARAAARTIGAARGAPRTSLNTPVGRGRRFVVVHLRLDEVKAAGRAQKATVNDVVLELVAGGLRGLLLSRREPVRGLTARASVMVAGRSGADAGELGNLAGVIVVPLPLDQDSPRTGLAAIADVTRREKAVQQAGFIRWLMVWFARSGIAQRYFRRQRMATVFETNVPGPPFPFYFLGARILDLVAIGGGAYGNVTLTFAALSYAGRLNVTVCADAASNPDLPVVKSAIESTWAQLTGPPADAGARQLASRAGS
jgi:WS/DGAT/MGAT family acyltransferase